MDGVPIKIALNWIGFLIILGYQQALWQGP